MTTDTGTPLDRLRAAVPMIDRESLDGWLAAPGPRVLFFSGGRAEANDVAVVLCEMRKAFGSRVVVGWAAPEDEHVIRTRFGVQVLPALVFLKDGTLMRGLFGIRDWAQYQEAFVSHFGVST